MIDIPFVCENEEPLVNPCNPDGKSNIIAAALTNFPCEDGARPQSGANITKGAVGLLAPGLEVIGLRAFPEVSAASSREAQCGRPCEPPTKHQKPYTHTRTCIHTCPRACTRTLTLCRRWRPRTHHPRL